LAGKSGGKNYTPKQGDWKCNRLVFSGRLVKENKKKCNKQVRNKTKTKQRKGKESKAKQNKTKQNKTQSKLFFLENSWNFVSLPCPFSFSFLFF